MPFTFDLDGLKKEITEHVYVNLSGGSDDVALWSLESAEMLTTTKFTKGGYQDSLDWTNQVIIRASLLYAVYYFYSRIENEETARDKRLDANELLSSIIGNYAYDIPQNGGSGGTGGGSSGGDISDSQQTVLKIVSGTDSWNNYGGTSGF